MSLHPCKQSTKTPQDRGSCADLPGLPEPSAQAERPPQQARAAHSWRPEAEARVSAGLAPSEGHE